MTTTPTPSDVLYRELFHLLSYEQDTPNQYFLINNHRGGGDGDVDEQFRFVSLWRCICVDLYKSVDVTHSLVDIQYLIPHYDDIRCVWHAYITPSYHIFYLYHVRLLSELVLRGLCERLINKDGSGVYHRYVDRTIFSADTITQQLIPVRQTLYMMHYAVNVILRDQGYDKHMEGVLWSNQLMNDICHNYAVLRVFVSFWKGINGFQCSDQCKMLKTRR
jgi:hypothetical protein